MTGVAYKLSMDTRSESKIPWRPYIRSGSVDTAIQQRLIPTVEPATLSSIGELLQFAFAEAPANEVVVIAEPEVSEAELFAAMDEAQDRVIAHLDERTKEHRISRRHARE